MSGARRSEKLHFRLSGACGMKSRQYCSTFVMSSPRHMPVPNRTERERMKLYVEFRDNAEITAAAAQRPEQVGVFFLAGADNGAVGDD